MSVSSNNNYIDVLNNAGVYSSLSVGTTAVELKVGASALVERQAVVIQPKDNGIFLGYSSGVTTATGLELFKDQIIIMPIGANIPVYLIASAAGKSARIGELS